MIQPLAPRSAPPWPAFSPPWPPRLPDASPQRFWQAPFSNPGQAYTVNLTPAEHIRLGERTPFTLRLFDPVTGQPPPAFAILHEKPAHLFVVSQDLADFQHLHPAVIGPGLLQTPMQFNRPGRYTLFTQFATPIKTGLAAGALPTTQKEHTLSLPFAIGSTQTAGAALQPDDRQAKWSNGYEYRVSGLPTQARPMGMIRVEVLKNGQPVQTIEPFLGAGAHGVILNQDASRFVHVHPGSQPVNGRYRSPVGFHADIPQPGLYKLWVQTRIDGQLNTVDWTFRV